MFWMKKNKEEEANTLIEETALSAIGLYIDPIAEISEITDDEEDDYQNFVSMVRQLFLDGIDLLNILNINEFSALRADFPAMGIAISNTIENFSTHDELEGWIKTITPLNSRKFIISERKKSFPELKRLIREFKKIKK